MVDGATYVNKLSLQRAGMHIAQNTIVYLQRENVAFIDPSVWS